MRGKMYCLGILCLVASTLALPTIPSSLSSNEIKENKELYKNNVEVHKAPFLTDESYAENTGTEDWIEEQEKDEYINDSKQDSKEFEDKEVGNDDEEDVEAEDEEVEVEEVDDEQDSDNEKYSNFEKSVIIKWKIPTSFLLNRLIANMSPVIRTPYPYRYQPFRFPYVQYPGFVNY